MDVGMDKLVSLCKRRGFIFPSSEIYGGINGFWDYGPLGVELKRNIKDAWWHDNCPDCRDDMVGLDCSIIMNPKVWEACGHVGGFNDPMVDCRATKERYRADQLYVFAYVFPRRSSTRESLRGRGWPAWAARPRTPRRSPEKKAAKLAKKFGQARSARPRSSPYLSARTFTADREKVIGPSTDDRGTLTEPRPFNLMFKTFVGALENDVERRLPPPRDGAGHLRQFQERGRHRARQASVRHRAGRQELPQRDQSAELHVPLARVRADGDRVLLPSRRGQRSGTPTGGRRGSSGTWTSACSRTGSGSATTIARSWPFTRRPPPTSSTPSPSASASSKASRTGATTTSAST